MSIWEMYNELLSLARNAIEYKLNNKKLEIPENIRKKYSGKKASFVTLTRKGELRGCIGNLYPKQELWKDIVENAIHAAFDDPRFPELRKEELSSIKIEISVLTIPKKIDFKDEKELLNKVDNGMGLILKKGFNSSTFLPQVWEEISGKTEFLEHLSLKAGFKKDAWKNSEIYFYRVKSVKE